MTRVSNIDLTPASNSAVDDGASAEDVSDSDLGPQHSGDTAFTRAMRRHQSWWRATKLRVPWGTGPSPNERRELGSMLRREDGARGMNFLTPDIHTVAQARLAESTGMVESFRLLHNMLSSQPMCFNLFGPLVGDLDTATDFMRELLPGEVERVDQVSLELAPTPASAYLADATAFDAFVSYRQPDGRHAFVGVETKLTEPFSQKTYDGEAYRRWMRGGEPVWKPDAWDHVADLKHNQLWRDHLLAVAMLRQPDSPWARGRIALVRHPLDDSCRQVAADYMSLLHPDDRTFLDLPLDRLIDTWARVVQTSHHRQWLADFRLRYLDLDASGTSTSSAGEGRPLAVRQGQWEAVRWMATAEFASLKAAYDSVVGEGGVYFRPTARGVVVISLDDAAPGYVGFRTADDDDGHVLKPRSPTPRVEEVRRRYEAFRAWLPTVARESREERAVIPWIRAALRNRLVLPGMGDEWVLLNQEWRFLDKDGRGKKSDVLAVHLASGRLGIVEAKDDRSKRSLAADQARAYLEFWRRDAQDLAPFFTETLRTVGQLYGNDLATSASVSTEPAAMFFAWPELDLRVEPLE
jgi:PD-(D/E)XK nuclease superfamily